MSQFNRGIKSQAFLTALDALYADDQSFWYKMVNDSQLFIAIRDESLDVYHKGNSICQICYRGNQITCHTHYKFLLNPDLKVYVKATGNSFQLNMLGRNVFSSLNDVSQIKKAASVYASEEKTGVHSFISERANILDVEVTLSSTGRKTDRIDFVQLEKSDDPKKARLVFFEAKHFSNPELRAAATPKVLGQIARYTQAIASYQPGILTAYSLVCENLGRLNLIRGKSDLIKAVAKGTKTIEIDAEPRLLVFGYDSDQESGKIWTGHRAKLEKALGKKRLITKGSV